MIIKQSYMAMAAVALPEWRTALEAASAGPAPQARPKPATIGLAAPASKPGQLLATHAQHGEGQAPAVLEPANSRAAPLMPAAAVALAVGAPISQAPVGTADSGVRRSWSDQVESCSQGQAIALAQEQERCSKQGPLQLQPVEMPSPGSEQAAGWDSPDSIAAATTAAQAAPSEAPQWQPAAQQRDQRVTEPPAREEAQPQEQKRPPSSGLGDEQAGVQARETPQQALQPRAQACEASAPASSLPLQAAGHKLFSTSSSDITSCDVPKQSPAEAAPTAAGAGCSAGDVVLSTATLAAAAVDGSCPPSTAATPQAAANSPVPTSPEAAASSAVPASLAPLASPTPTSPTALPSAAASARPAAVSSAAAPAASSEAARDEAAASAGQAGSFMGARSQHAVAEATPGACTEIGHAPVSCSAMPSAESSQQLLGVPSEGGASLPSSTDLAACTAAATSESGHGQGRPSLAPSDASTASLAALPSTEGSWEAVAPLPAGMDAVAAAGAGPQVAGSYQPSSWGLSSIGTAAAGGRLSISSASLGLAQRAPQIIQGGTGGGDNMPQLSPGSRLSLGSSLSDGRPSLGGASSCDGDERRQSLGRVSAESMRLQLACLHAAALHPLHRGRLSCSACTLLAAYPAQEHIHVTVIGWCFCAGTGPHPGDSSCRPAQKCPRRVCQQLFSHPWPATGGACSCSTPAAHVCHCSWRAADAPAASARMGLGCVWGGR